MTTAEQKEKLQTRIAETNQQIAGLKQVLANDVGASYKEAAQTNDMIQSCEMQLASLHEELISLDEKTTQYVLKAKDGCIRKLTLVAKNPDPSVGKISVDSPIGKILSESKQGDRIVIGSSGYVLTMIIK
jgi:transcription elongation GreA/GreB family factor